MLWLLHALGRCLSVQRQPLVQLIGDRPPLQRSHSPSLLAAQFPGLALKVVELAEELQRFFGQETLVVDPQIVELPARMREAIKLSNSSGKQPM